MNVWMDARKQGWRNGRIPKRLELQINLCRPIRQTYTYEFSHTTDTFKIVSFYRDDMFRQKTITLLSGISCI